MLPWNGLTNGAAPGVAVFFAFWSWVGFEAAPNYAEEAKDPVRVIPIALIFSCVAVGMLYTIMSWAIVSAYGTNTDWAKVAQHRQHRRVQRQDRAGRLRPLRARARLGRWPAQFWASALSYLIITGSLACAAALTNAGLRYMYAMGREGLMPRYLGKTHPGAQVALHGGADVGRAGGGAVPASSGSRTTRASTPTSGSRRRA